MQVYVVHIVIKRRKRRWTYTIVSDLIPPFAHLLECTRMRKTCFVSLVMEAAFILCMCLYTLYNKFFLAFKEFIVVLKPFFSISRYLLVIVVVEAIKSFSFISSNSSVKCSRASLKIIFSWERASLFNLPCFAVVLIQVLHLFLLWKWNKNFKRKFCTLKYFVRKHEEWSTLFFL